MYERILEEFLLHDSGKKQKIFSFFKSAQGPAKTGYLKGVYKTGITIVSGYYVECSSHGIEIERRKTEKYTWRQVAGIIENLISRGMYIRIQQKTEKYTQMSIFDI